MAVETINPVHELNDLHFQLAALYRRGADQNLIDGYWEEIDALEAEHGAVGGWLR